MLKIDEIWALTKSESRVELTWQEYNKWALEATDSNYFRGGLTIILDANHD